MTALIDRIPRLDTSRPGLHLDTSMPVMVLWVSQFPLQHGSLGVFRSLGRAGVPAYAVVGHRYAPAAWSRYVKGRVVWRPHRGDGEAELLQRLLEFGRTLSTKCLIVCTSDDMAVFAARHREALEECYVLPAVAPELPAELVDKRQLDRLCLQHGVPVPRSAFVHTMAELEAVIGDLDEPAIVKSAGPRGPSRRVENTLVVPDRTALRELASTLEEPFDLTIQEYLPDEYGEDWFTVGYCDASATARPVFTGRKSRAWPARGGAASAGFTAVNSTLADMATAFCKDIGYRGIFDMDWRRDLRTGKYKLLDFNPRPGAQFRMFENDAGVDVVRAMHLDLSGRPIPPGSQVIGERFIIEPWDFANWVAHRRKDRPALGGFGRARLAYLAADDPIPILAVIVCQLYLSLASRLPFLSR
ncbi:hypothetical protein [Mycobacterium sp. M26]|uniref:carboxylate--amine ligase n=1 Tax=Mycobacterium sp. M26 TaxID=1762962 RepID=UPI00073E46F6|nr:hypothetical protein [Mycobacterium sp. M26]